MFKPSYGLPLSPLDYLRIDLSVPLESSMTVPAIPTSSIAPASVPPAVDPSREAEPSATSSGTAVKKDQAIISADGRQALAKHEDAATTQSPAVKVLSNVDAAIIGQGLKRSNPAHFKAYDTNGDGKLSAQEVRAAGLG